MVTLWGTSGSVLKRRLMGAQAPAPMAYIPALLSGAETMPSEVVGAHLNHLPVVQGFFRSLNPNPKFEGAKEKKPSRKHRAILFLMRPSLQKKPRSYALTMKFGCSRGAKHE